MYKTVTLNTISVLYDSKNEDKNPVFVRSMYWIMEVGRKKAEQPPLQNLLFLKNKLGTFQKSLVWKIQQVTKDNLNVKYRVKC